MRQRRVRVPEGRALLGNRIVQQFSTPTIEEARTIALTATQQAVVDEMVPTVDELEQARFTAPPERSRFDYEVTLERDERGRLRTVHHTPHTNLVTAPLSLEPIDTALANLKIGESIPILVPVDDVPPVSMRLEGSTDGEHFEPLQVHASGPGFEVVDHSPGVRVIPPVNYIDALRDHYGPAYTVSVDRSSPDGDQTVIFVTRFDGVVVDRRFIPTRDVEPRCVETIIDRNVFGNIISYVDVMSDGSRRDRVEETRVVEDIRLEGVDFLVPLPSLVDEPDPEGEGDDSDDPLLQHGAGDIVATERDEYLTMTQWAQHFSLPRSRIYVELARMGKAPGDIWYGPERNSYGQAKENAEHARGITDDGLAIIGQDSQGRQKSVTYYRIDLIEIVNERLRVREENRQRAADLDRELGARIHAASRGPIVPLPTGRRIRL